MAKNIDKQEEIRTPLNNSARTRHPSQSNKPSRVLFAGFILGLILALSYSSYKPKMNKHRLAQVIANKHRDDQYLLESNHSNWYEVDMDKLDDELKAKFIQSEADQATKDFIEDSVDKSDAFFTQLWHSLAKTLMSFFYSQTDINGYLQRGSMFVLSKQQFKTLTEGHLKANDLMIDLGAGDGKPTEVMAGHFNKVRATEMSKAMVRLLTAKGYEVMDIEDWHQSGDYDLVSCLNLLDRCDRPLDVLDQIHQGLKDEGLLILALVLPFKPYVEFNSSDHKPSQKLELDGTGFEGQIADFARIFRDSGFELLRWTRVPYLCEGDWGRSIYSLDDAVFVLKKIKKL